MALTPATTDDNRNNELKRRQEQPDTFGVGDRRANETTQKVQQQGGKTYR